MPSRYNFHRFRRGSIRLKGYDYRKPGYYFVTFCTKNRERFFGTVVDAKMQLSKIGEIVCQCWYEIPKHFNHVQLDAFIVMPDHIHGIIIIDDYPGGLMACHETTDRLSIFPNLVFLLQRLLQPDHIFLISVYLIFLFYLLY